ncbi:uncharacterized protein LOC110463739 [Mizuhopecten yessoensis]|uniref:uncharacterized protein LOC110463739 n=1 Tax=Mizuhopecten yessoensis TaxID=6573 RepID=UPI000B45E8DC|nr:uncharacterized protein LOC110463739 [Mizuhopecten yessoensis]
MDRVAFYGVLIASLYYADATINCGTCLQPPDYVSSFIKLKAQSTQSEAIILHNIAEVPIKVDVQVKPISGNDTNYFFPGLGSSQQDDDKQGVYGGVVYKYNETAVKLYVPNRNDGSGDGSVIFTGYNNAWVGPKVQKEDAAEVRVRVWTACKFPTPDYESNWIPMKIKNGTDSFREVVHGLGYVPNYVTVQVWNNGTDWYADGIASGMTPNNVNKLTSWGGVVYAFDDNHVRIWVPGFDTGSMFSVADGWGQGSQETWSEGLVKVKALSGDNNGFSFPAFGAVQNTDPHDKFGGVVYSYSSHGIRVWHPIVPGAGNTALSSTYHSRPSQYIAIYRYHIQYVKFLVNNFLTIDIGTRLNFYNRKISHSFVNVSKVFK